MMRIYLTIAFFFFFATALFSQQAIVAEFDYVEVEVQLGTGHIKAMYRSSEHRFQYVKGEDGKNFKFASLAQLFQWIDEQGFVMVTQHNPLANTNSHAFLFKKE